MRKMMASENWEYQSEPFKRAQARGEARARRNDLVAVLEDRGLALTSEQRERIEDTHDEETLMRWLLRAVKVATVDEVFAD